MTRPTAERLGPLRERPFRLLWMGQATSAVGDNMTPVALAFAVLGLGTAGDLGLVFATFAATHVAFVLAGGVWADRLQRRIVMLAADLVRAAAGGVVASLLVLHVAEVWHLVVWAAVYGAADAFFAPASTGLVPETVTAARLQQANALMGLSRSGTSIVAPAVAGLVVAAVGSGWVFALDALTFVVSAAFLALLPSTGHERTGRRTFVGDLAAGWREVRARAWLSASLVGFGIGNMAWTAHVVLGPAVTRDELGGATAWGAIAAAMGAGGVVGGLLALRWKPQRLIFAGAVVTFAMAVELAAFAAAPPVPALMIAAAAASVSVVLANVFWETAVQQRVPAGSLSRVSSYDLMASLALAPVGYLLWPLLSGRIGIDAALLLAAAAVAAGNVVVLAVPEARRLRRLDAAGLGRAHAPLSDRCSGPARLARISPDPRPAPRSRVVGAPRLRLA